MAEAVDVAGEGEGGDSASSARRAPPISSAMPPPSSTVSTRSTPGKHENGPDASTRAVLIRQSKASNPAPSGEATISAVVPPPFFHGRNTRSARG